MDLVVDVSSRIRVETSHAEVNWSSCIQHISSVFVFAMRSLRLHYLTRSSRHTISLGSQEKPSLKFLSLYQVFH